MKKYVIYNTNEGFCDGIEFSCKNNEDAELVAEGVLESHGYSEFCDENGYYSYNFGLKEL